MASNSGNSKYYSIKTHYARLGHASQNLFPKMMQGVLKLYKQKEHVYKDCYNDKHLNKILTSGEWRILSTAANDGYERFDIPLIYKLLRNLNLIQPPTKYWNHPHDPSSNETTIGDDIERIRRKRNEIIHRGNTIVTDRELKENFTIFKEIARRFETLLKVPTDYFVYKFEDLESCCMDEETEEKYLRDLETYQEENKSLKDIVLSLEEEKVQVIIPPEDTTCIEGEDTNFECVVVGCKTEPKWYKEGQEVLADNTRIETNNQTIKYVISKASIENRGRYTMEIGDQSYEVYLNVEEKKPTLIELRKYQEELAKIALKGENTIICSGTNSGKTYVAFHIMENHFLRNKEGKVVFLSRTNVLLEQQYERACSTFKDLHFQGKIHRWRASDEGECDPFLKIVKRVRILFCTPESLCNHLDTDAKSRVSISDFSLIILDECHHVVRQNPYNKIMNYYRRHIYGTKFNAVPQIVGLTASPGTNKANNEASAIDHLKTLMINMDVAKFSVVRENKEELLEYTSEPVKVLILSTRRHEDTVQKLLLETIKGIEEMFSIEKRLTASPGTNKANNEASAIDHLKTLMINMDVAKLSVVRENKEELLEYTSAPVKVLILSTRRHEDTVQKLLLETIKGIEEMFSIEKIQAFLLENSDKTRSLLDALRKPPQEKTEMSYIQWVAGTKSEIESVILKDDIVPRLLHSCFRHLEIYVDCLEINTLLEIENVRDIVKDAYGRLSFQSQNSDIQEERLLVEKLKEVFLRLVQQVNTVERNPDVHEIIKTLQREYENHKDDSRFLIFVKTRATAKALSERLPAYLKSFYLTGRASSEKCGLDIDEQLEVVDKFRNGYYLTLVVTSVACEGLDIQQCNLAIRYKFRVDEISSFQMRGRIRSQSGKEVVLAAAEDLQSEELNILRQFYMEKAIDKVMNMDLTRNLAIAGKDLYDSEERERWLTKMKLEGKLKSSFSVHCKQCGKFISDGQYLRHINRRQFIVYDKAVFSRIQCDPLKKVEKFDAMKKIERAIGIYPCEHHWGSILMYEGCKFLALSREYVNMFTEGQNYIKFKKWIDFPYEIDSLTDREISEY